MTGKEKEKEMLESINKELSKLDEVECEYYFDKDKNDKKKQRKYLVNPYFLINNQGKYYLVCNYDYFDKIANYKITGERKDINY